MEHCLLGVNDVQVALLRASDGSGALVEAAAGRGGSLLWSQAGDNCLLPEINLAYGIQNTCLLSFIVQAL